MSENTVLHLDWSPFFRALVFENILAEDTSLVCILRTSKLYIFCGPRRAAGKKDEGTKALMQHCTSPQWRKAVSPENQEITNQSSDNEMIPLSKITLVENVLIPGLRKQIW